MDKYIQDLNVLCSNEHFYNDEDFAKRLNRIYESAPSNVLLNHSWSNNIIARRVNEYCKQHKIEVKDYSGPLPFRVFVIPKTN